VVGGDGAATPDVQRPVTAQLCHFSIPTPKTALYRKAREGTQRREAGDGECCAETLFSPASASRGRIVIGWKRRWLPALIACFIAAGCTGVRYQMAPDDQTVPIHNDAGGGDSGM